ncbi:uncharacterized protein LOC122062434 [Macadamia integrifolia]|uniref:uncharacterized protein LOC122062434 n=1 Tax=Macadamia integrifolia TaxID=60698 RepID=UPI001C4EF190|nr:uncharacterized protein LOC122062434 [Macadamia integrifolia]
MSFFEALLGFCLISWLSLISAQTHLNETQFPDSDFKTEPTAYEMLEKFNFPKGILPEGAKGYVLHDDNRFEVYLDGNCNFNVDGGYSLYYSKKITGRVGYGSLTDLKGVSVKILFIWLGINEVSIEAGNLDFYVGPLSASFPLSNFEECPQCGRGVNCPKLVSDS